MSGTSASKKLFNGLIATISGAVVGIATGGNLVFGVMVGDGVFVGLEALENWARITGQDAGLEQETISRKIEEAKDANMHLRGG